MSDLIKFSLVLFVVLIFTHCSVIDIKKEAPEVNELNTETEFRIILPEDHRTGYMWQLTQDYNTANIQQINEVWHGNEKGIYFHLKTLSPGETKLTFISRKYTDTADIKHFIVKIVKK